MTQKFLMFFLSLFLFISVQIPSQAITIEIIFDNDELIKNARKAMHEGRLEEAAGYYEQALRAKGRKVSKAEMIHARSDLCVAYMYLARFEEAIRQCKIGLDLKPNRWETLNNLATAFLMQGDYENAQALYQRALRMNPRSRVLLKNIEIARIRAEAAENGTLYINDPGDGADFPDAHGDATSSSGLN